MALPKKGLRKINVDDQIYGWSVTGNDGWISLSIALLENNGQLLTAKFDYQNIQYTEDDTMKAKPQLVVTPHVVRQVIEYALKNGWTPAIKKPQMDLGNTNNIKLIKQHK